MGLCGEICYLKQIQISKRIFSIDGKISKRNRRREKALPAPFEFSCYVIEVTCSSPVRLCSPISKSPAVNGARRLNVEAGQKFCGLNRRCRMRFLVRVGRKGFVSRKPSGAVWVEPEELDAFRGYLSDISAECGGQCPHRAVVSEWMLTSVCRAGRVVAVGS